jgi:predicted Zn-dependent protease with MMP-like domain
MTLTAAEFEQLVAKGIDRIPERFLEKLENVAIVVEDEPTKEQLVSVGLSVPGDTLLGLYEGVSHVDGGHYHRGMPDRITLFRLPILEEAETKDDIADIVADTVWHEIAHHFGMNEDEVEAAEDKRWAAEDTNHA